MAHKFVRSLFGLGDTSKTVAAPPCGRSTLGSVVNVVTGLLVLASVVPLRLAAQTSTYVPAVVASSVSPVPTTPYPLPLSGQQTNLVGPTEVAVDTCGNIYTLDHGYDGSAPVTEIPAGGGPATAVIFEGNTWGIHMGQDASHTNLLVGRNYNSSAQLIPLINCVPQPSQAKNWGGGSGALFYYYDPGEMAGDFLGNVYITTNGTCCVTGSFYLIQEVNATGNVILSNTANEILSPAIDKLQNVYFIEGAKVYELPYSGTGVVYAAAPMAFGNYLNPVGLSMDTAGNLYVADSSAAAIYEIPNEAATALKPAGLNLADQFVVASGVNIGVAVAVNARGDMYYTASGASNVSELALGNANFNSVAAGQSATRVINFQFNAAATLTSIQAPSGAFTILAPNPGTTACVTGTAYGPTATSSCQITVGFSPASAGKQSSAVVLSYTVGTAARTITAFVEGIGQGAVLTLDPGTVASTGSGFRSPASIAVDGAGDTFIADTGNNAVLEFPVGGGATVTVAIENAAGGVTPPLSAPAGVAVDGAGDVFIADTGNNRVVEVPFVKGALSPAGSTVIVSGLKNPSGVFVHTNGDLYVADTGDNTILAYPSYNGASNAGAVFGTPTKLGIGLSAPLAVTVDGSGNVYIADSGNDQILEYPLGGEQETVAANILNPSALATDSSGSLFVVDQGNYRVLRISSVQGTLNPNGAAEVGLGIASPYGVAIDSSSNLYVTDKTNAAAYTISRSQIGLAFGDLAVGTASTALPLTVESAGNLPLVFSSPYFVETGNGADFAMTSPTGACANGLTLPTGTNCDLATTFTPTVAGPRSATIAFAGNAANAPQVTVTGTGVSPSPTTTTLALITSVAGAPFYGEPLTFTATMLPAGGTGTPTGSVSFVLDGTQVALIPVVKGVASLQLNSGLSGGAHSIYAAYKGDTSDNASSSAVMQITIARAPTTPILTIAKIPYNNPYSLRHSNNGSCNVLDTLGYTNLFPAVPNDPIGLTASVTSPGVGVPSGTLTFYSDGQLINGAPNSKTGLPASMSAVVPASGGGFAGSMTSSANTLGDGTTLGENNVLVTPHVITVVYSGDQNYLPSTSTSTTVIVTDVNTNAKIGPTTPILLPQTPASPPPYCAASSTITVSEPSDPSAFEVTASSNNITASAMAPGTATLTISSLSGWTGGIDFSCTNLPQYTTCSFNPGQATIGSSTPGSTTVPSQVVMTITTNVPPYVPTATQQSGFFWPASALLGLLTIASRRRFRRAAGALTIAGFALLLVAGIAGLSGCGSSSTPTVVTKPGTYPITVVLTGAQHGGLDATQYNEVFQADVPYPMTFNLTVQ